MEFEQPACALREVELSENQIEIWCSTLQAGAAIVARLASTLSDDEHDRAARFRFERDRRRFIVAHGVLRTILGSYLGLAPQCVVFCAGPFGKPALSGSNGSAGLFFNMSHANELALIGVTDVDEIGIDVEYVRPLAEMEQIARAFFAADEVDTLLNLPAEMRSQAFLSCWTRKEAFIKAIGEGLSHPLDSFSVTLEASAPPRLLRIDGDTPADWSLTAAEPAPGYVAACAIRRPAVVVRWSCFEHRASQVTTI